MLDMTAYQAKLTEACERYERHAPTVQAHCDDLYRRINERPETVTLAELCGTQALWADGWAHPNYAANLIYKLRHRLGLDTAGHAGF